MSSCVRPGRPSFIGAPPGLGRRLPIPARNAAGCWNAIAAGGRLEVARLQVVTGLLLYVPLALFGVWHFVTQGDVSPGGALVAALLGGSYHLWASVLHSLRARPKDRPTGPLRTARSSWPVCRTCAPISPETNLCRFEAGQGSTRGLTPCATRLLLPCHLQGLHQIRHYPKCRLGGVYFRTR